MARKQKVKVFEIKDSLFGGKTLFLINCNIAYLERYLKKHYKIDDNFSGWEEEGTSGCMITYSRPRSLRVVWLKRWNNSILDMGILVHELMHLVIRICESSSVPIESGSKTRGNADETIAYLIEFYFTEALKNIRK